MIKKLSIGRGKNMSIPKAGLIFYYEKLLPEHSEMFPRDNYKPFLTWGDLSFMHDIVTIAGAEHRSFLTPVQVSTRLARSPYWDAEFIQGFYSGFRGGQANANCLRPSDRGRQYYEKHLKNRTEAAGSRAQDIATG